MSQTDIDKYYGEWYEHPDLKDLGPSEYSKNTKACLDALDYYNSKDRPLNILAVHGSGRHPTIGCSHELSNSELLLETGLDPYRDEGYDIESVHLREYNVSPCNGCVSTASVNCGFPCDCFPLDPMQALYPKVLRCDILLLSTGVQQATMSSRMKTFLDRLISLDGGFYRGGYKPKDAEFRAKTIEASREGNFEYTQRMFGRVGAYFISSKDQNNPEDKWFDYIKRTAETLKMGQEAYGILHADKWYCGHAAKWDEDYSHDKANLSDNSALHKEAQNVVGWAISYAKELKDNPPSPVPGRKNRT